MKTLPSLSSLPNVPAVYALYGGKGRDLYIAYIGVADAFKTRIYQHLVRRDSSIATNTSTIGLNVEYVTEVRWWEHPEFSKRHILTAAELVAFDVFDPVLRSRGVIEKSARQLYADDAFNTKMRGFFSNGSTGRVIIPTLNDALAKIDALEKRVTALEAALKGK